jgi:prophage tail gpP-like protein
MSRQDLQTFLHCIIVLTGSLARMSRRSSVGNSVISLDGDSSTPFLSCCNQLVVSIVYQQKSYL